MLYDRIASLIVFTKENIVKWFIQLVLLISIQCINIIIFYCRLHLFIWPCIFRNMLLHSVFSIARFCTKLTFLCVFEAVCHMKSHFRFINFFRTIITLARRICGTLCYKRWTHLIVSFILSKLYLILFK